MRTTDHDIHAYKYGQKAINEGICALPLRPYLDGKDHHKIPTLHGWAKLPLANAADVFTKSYKHGHGMGVGLRLGEAGPRNLCVLDIESVATWERYKAAVEKEGLGHVLEEKCGLVRTGGGGVHVYLSVSASVLPQKAAERLASSKSDPTNKHAEDKDGYKIAIELLSVGKQVVRVPSYGAPEYTCMGKEPYDAELLQDSEFRALTLVARSLCQMPTYTPPRESARIVGHSGARIGDVFNADPTYSHADYLKQAQWTYVRTVGDEEHWERPGKSVSSTSACWNTKMGQFYVYTTNAPPFEPNTSYSKFGIFAMLRHNGSFGLAAAELRKMYEVEKEGLGAEVVDGVGSDSGDDDGVGNPGIYDVIAYLQSPIPEVPRTGLEALDGIVRLAPGQVFVLAARPSMGKTALGFQIARAVADEHRVLFYSLEMSRIELETRALIAETKIQKDVFDKRVYTVEQKLKMAEAGDRLAKKHYAIIDDVTTIEALIAHAKKKHEKRKVDMIVVDYLQLLNTDLGTDNREREIASISRSLKKLGRDLGCVILALAQINRGVESRQDKRPSMSDLRESGAIEQDADVVMLLYREGYYDKKCKKPRRVELIVAKNRHGATGKSEMDFEPELTTFLDVKWGDW